LEVKKLLPQRTPRARINYSSWWA